MLSSVSSGLLYGSKNYAQINSIIPQIDYIPKFIEQLQTSPDEIFRDFEEIRKHGEIFVATGVEFGVDGAYSDICLDLRLAW